MSEREVNDAIGVLARADLPGEPVSAETILLKMALRQRLKRASHGSRVLEKGLPAVLAAVCVVAGVLVVRLLATDQPPTLAVAAWAALATLGTAAALASAQLLPLR